jgi:hypothetical protein
VVKPLKDRANHLAAEAYSELIRSAKRAYVPEEKRRALPPRVKEDFVRAKGYKNITLRSEDVAEFDYQPGACSRPYRMVVLRKNLTIERGDTPLFDDIRYFFYITNDRSLSAFDVVLQANQRCNQENLIAQLKHGVRALHAPTNTLNANWAYMLMASLAWTLKAWMAMFLPVLPQFREQHEAERRKWLRMDFRTFRNRVINIPAQILTSGRKRIWRLLAWRPDVHILIRLVDSC